LKKEMDAKPLYGCIEAGGTHFVVATSGADTTTIVESHEFATTTPDETLQQAYDWLASRHITHLGIASFGPVDLNPKSATYGYITATPKPHWGNTDVVGRFRSLNVPIGFQTDVNAAAISELTLGGHG
jgi:fructokinase